jgi:demethylmenaquinone methyltransferase/2-methoxy-6-polyprenyl-1,4-benzoquinol methylase
LIKLLYRWYMGKLAPSIAKIFNQNKKAYQYLNESSIAFPDRQLFIDILKGVGYSDTYFKPLSLGICCIYCGRKSQG